MEALGHGSPVDASVYLTGGATAVLHGWRTSTLDVDLHIEPEADEILRLLPRLKDELEINLELASPAHFIPELPGWRDRRRYIERYGRVTVYHYDPYGQLLSKIERGHVQDRQDVADLLSSGLVEPDRARALFQQIEPRLFRFPSIDPPSFRRAVEEALGSSGELRGSQDV